MATANCCWLQPGRPSWCAWPGDAGRSEPSERGGDRSRREREVLLAATLQGAIFAAARAAVDRAATAA
ncbi:DUF4235 domain-containing protein [Streptomyces sp. DSM 41699]|uniref:DUF4235 domain-containing protein n=1 Tax=Streptomyces gibsoniae TaxID=3075529 RepID=A0ABU2U7D5_9ACTN|nr:DUF4235 domain-containing protein [Streptomyces sp. DSM 41699]MDT0469146.1 DUF4235 domain-containing protein [Streptomyces sp. DSM 41699]